MMGATTPGFNGRLDGCAMGYEPSGKPVYFSNKSSAYQAGRNVLTNDSCGYVYWLPGADRQMEERRTSINSVVIIGANGSGKSKLGAWIEQQNLEKVHRIAAQRNLNFSERVPLKSYTEAEETLFYGGTQYKEGKSERWNWGKGYTTKLLDDFDAALAALLAQVNLENQRYVDACKGAELRNEPKPDVPTTVFDKLQHVWNFVFPHRKIFQEDAAFYAYIDDPDERYSATQMSDGERSVLYLAAQVLCVPESKIIIMDEPEIHLHPSLMGHLWNALEKERPDCLFIYITHDVDFATTHRCSDIIWVKSYDGDSWVFENIPQSELPMELLVELLGNRKTVLFVEGNKDSLDNRVYSALFPDCYVVPSGGCEQVVANVRAYSRTAALHACKTWGIVDRDFKADDVLDSYEKDGVYALGVAEIENLFIVEEVIRAMARQFGVDEDAAFERVRSEVFSRYANQLEGQVGKALMAEIKCRLASIDVTREDFDVSEIAQTIDLQSTGELVRSRLQGPLDVGDYAGVLRVFNEKSLAKSVGSFVGTENKQYIDRVLALLGGALNEELKAAMAPYVPSMPFE